MDASCLLQPTHRYWQGDTALRYHDHLFNNALQYMKQYKRLSKPQTMALALGLLATGGVMGMSDTTDVFYTRMTGQTTVEQRAPKTVSSYSAKSRSDGAARRSGGVPQTT